MPMSYKIRYLLPGTYTAKFYDPVLSAFGKTYKIVGEHENGETFTFWSNSYLNTYINNLKNKFEFQIIIDENSRVTIPGYTTILKLIPMTKV